MRNSVLKEAIAGVLNSGTPSQFSMELEFISSSDSSYAYVPLRVDGLHINQDSVKNYSDDITVQFMISAADYANMYDHLQDLHVVVSIAFHDANCTRLMKVQPIIVQYRAAIVDPKDLRKEMVDAHLRTEVDRSVKVRLIEDAIYTARSVPINTIYRSVTVTDAIHHASNAFGITGITMETADNIHVYDHLLVPPMKKFSNFYSWLQHEYGVYLCGMVHYYTGGHLYVYAPFNMTPTTTTTLSVFQAEQGSVGGATCTSALSSTLIEVVTDTVHAVTDNTAYGAENVGTSMTFMRSSQLQDGVVEYDPVNGAKFKDDIVLTVGLAKTPTLTSGVDRPRYAATTDNVFALSSAMTEHQTTTVLVEWTTAIPFSLRPGLAVHYYSDQKGSLLKRLGILESINLIMIRIDRSAGGTSASQDIYKASAKLQIRLQPEGVITTTIS